MNNLVTHPITCNTGNYAVDFLSHCNILNIIFSSNLDKKVTTDAGRPYRLAIELLRDIIRWYQPTRLMDDEGNLIGYKKKFKADYIQLTYSVLADNHNENKQNISRAMSRLEELGLIKKHLRTLITSSGKKLYNVLYVELKIGKLMEIVNGSSTTASDTTEECFDAYNDSNVSDVNSYADVSKDITNQNSDGVNSDCTPGIRNDNTNTVGTYTVNIMNDCVRARVELITECFKDIPGFTLKEIIKISETLSMIKSLDNLRNYLKSIIKRMMKSKQTIKHKKQYVKGVIINDIMEEKIIYLCKQRDKSVPKGNDSSTSVRHKGGHSFPVREYDYKQLEKSLIFNGC